MQPIDTWFRNHRLALLFEARVGDGRLVVASMDLAHDLAQRPAARQMRTSILRYMAGPGFAPPTALTPDDVARLLAPRP